ncbi:MAG: alpha/beta hydrolase [Pseudomonadales bacterium]
MTSPDWFNHAIAVPRSSRSILIKGCNIHFDQWPSPGPDAPGLLFVHGNGAHSHWWDFIAPAFRNNFNVMAMDMSGAGDSGHRDHYSAVTFASEIFEVCNQLKSKCYVVGHSFGGGMTRITGFLHGSELAGIVLVDSGISANRGRREPPRPPRDTIRYYPTLADGMKRFRLRPPQPCANDYILDYIAAHSLLATEQGYRFKLDQSLFAKMTEDEAIDLPDSVSMISRIPCPIGFIYGQQSRFFPPENIERLNQLIDPTLLAAIPDAHHHVFLDQPLAFIDSLAGILTQLEHN